MQTGRLRAQAQRFAKFPLGARDISQDGIVLRHHFMGTRGVREASFELVKDLFGEQAGSPAVIIEQLGIIRALSQSLRTLHGLGQFARVQQCDTERVLSVGLLQVWNRFGGVPLGSECVSQQAVGGLKAGAELDGPLERRNGGGIIALLDVHPTEIGERDR